MMMPISDDPYKAAPTKKCDQYVDGWCTAPDYYNTNKTEHRMCVDPHLCPYKGAENHEPETIHVH